MAVDMYLSREHPKALEQFIQIDLEELPLK